MKEVPAKLSITGTITLTGDLEIPSERTVTITGSGEDAKIETSGEYTIFDQGQLNAEKPVRRWSNVPWLCPDHGGGGPMLSCTRTG